MKQQIKEVTGLCIIFFLNILDFVLTPFLRKRDHRRYPFKKPPTN